MTDRVGIRRALTVEDVLVDTFVYLGVALAFVVTLYPFVFVLSMSISDPVAVARREVFLLPKGFSLDAYRTVLGDPTVIRSYYNTIWYTSVGTTLNLVFTVMAAYPLSKRNFSARGVLMFLAAAQHRVGAVREQQPYRLGVAVRFRSGLLELHRAVQRPVAVRGGRQDVHVGPLLDQKRDHLGMTAVAGVHQHLPVAGDLRIRPDRYPYRVQVAPSGGSCRGLRLRLVHGGERIRAVAGAAIDVARASPSIVDNLTSKRQCSRHEGVTRS